MSEQQPEVEVSAGFTRNMENFESLRVDVGVRAVARPGEKVDEAIDRVYAKIEKKLIEKVSSATEELIEMDARFRDKYLGRK